MILGGVLLGNALTYVAINRVAQFQFNLRSRETFALGCSDQIVRQLLDPRASSSNTQFLVQLNAVQKPEVDKLSCCSHSSLRPEQRLHHGGPVP